MSQPDIFSNAAKAQLDTARYRGWTGRIRPAWFACWPIARTGLRLMFRRKLFWLFLVLASSNFLRMFITIYIKAEISAQSPGMKRMIDLVLNSMTGEGMTYCNFMFQQGTITILMLAFAGETLVGNDYRHGGLTFYLSRRIGRRHFIAGKLLSIGLLVQMITAAPALILFAEYGLLTDSMTYLAENWRILVSIACYGLVMAAALGLLLFAAAAWLQKTVPLVMFWTCMFILVPAIANLLYAVYDRNAYWLLPWYWNDIRLVGTWCFGAIDSDPQKELFSWSLAIVCGVCAASALSIFPRLRATNVAT
jgi:ABC-type transport system involved in multi-copper enzyme maturation permease subunit